MLNLRQSSALPKFEQTTSLTWFSAVWALILLVPLLPQLPVLATNQPWRVELLASFLLLVFILLKMRHKIADFQFSINKEFYWIIVPILAFIAWSGFSAMWADSWKSVAHHTLIWACYLIFYFLFRRVIMQPRDFQLSIISLGVVVWIVALPCVIEYLLAVEKDIVTDIGIRYGKYSEMLNTIMPLFLALTLRLRGIRFWLSAGTILLCWLLVLCSLSRSSLLIFLVGVLLFSAACYLTRQSPQVKRRIPALLVLMIATLLLSQFSFNNKKSTLERFNSEETTQSTAVRPLFGAIALEMLKENPLTGIGADNYGLKFTEYRAHYAVKFPTDKNLETAEYFLAERAHNEYLQVFAELGLIGGICFGGFLFGNVYLFWLAFRQRKRLSLLTIAALCGMLMFLTSSLVSSFSFRLMPSGIAYFFMLALAAKNLFDSEKILNRKFVLVPKLSFAVSALAAIACISLFTLSASRAASQVYLMFAQSEPSLEKASSLYQKATDIDDENAPVYYNQGVRLLLQNRSSEALPFLEKAVNLGLTASACYSHLASAHTLAGDNKSAEKVMAQAVKVYPRSVFVRIRYSTLLEINGNTEMAKQNFETALALNEKAARGWSILINEGATIASLKAFRENQSTPPMDLAPHNAVFAVLDEREIIHPEEKIKVGF